MNDAAVRGMKNEKKFEQVDLTQLARVIGGTGLTLWDLRVADAMDRKNK